MRRGNTGGKMFAVFFISLCFFPLTTRAAAYTLPTRNQVDGFLVTQTLTRAKSPYFLHGGCQTDNRIPPGVTVTIEAGVVVKFGVREPCQLGNQSGGLLVYGNLIVNGTAEDPVIFTSWYDDAAGGDTNGDLGLSSPHAGDWNSIRIQQPNMLNLYPQTVSISHAIFRYGTTALSFSSVAPVQLDSVELAWNGTAIAAFLPLAVHNSRFHHNSLAINANTVVVDATNNWWGDDSGPSVASNPSGTGDRIQGVVLYDPWVGKPLPNQPPTLLFMGDSGYVDDGVEPNLTFGRATTTWQVVYADPDNNPPASMKVVVNGTSYDMGQVTGLDGNFVNGERYQLATSTFGKGIYSYHFETSDGKAPARLPATEELSFEVRNVPVILVPGILGTEMKKGDETLWMDLGRMTRDVGDEFMNPLAMNADGTPSDTEVVIGDVLRKPAAIFDYFFGLIGEFNKVDYRENTDLFVFPYDWRLGLEGTGQLLNDKINTVLAQTGSSHVNVVAHSMGGLVLKKYLFDHPANKVGTSIFLGVPELGAPKAAKTLMFGDDFGIPFLSQIEMKTLGRHMRSVYELLPSVAYLANVGPYVRNFDVGLDIASTTSFLVNAGADAGLIAQAVAFHTPAFDAFSPSGTAVYAIQGCKKPTIGEIVRRNKVGKGGSEYAVRMVAGDGTVPLPSSDALNLDVSHRFYVTGADHSKMPSQDGIRQLIVQLVSGSFATSSLPHTILQDKAGCVISGKLVSVHSPVDLHVVDSSGNHMGPNDVGAIDKDIPGATYEEIDHNKFVFLPEDAGQTYTVNLDATATGTFSLDVADVDGGETTRTVHYSDVPITPASQGQMAVTAVSADTVLQFDSAGSGNYIPLPASAVLNAASSQDFVPPATTITLSGSFGDNGWYRSAVQMSLVATDDNAGVLKTEYSLDGGATWQMFTGAIALDQEGVTNILYQSVDKAGNREEPKAQAVKVDTIVPEATIVFDSVTKDVVVKSLDIASSATVVDTGNMVKVTDEAGNTLELNFTEKDRKKTVKAELQTMKYNGQELKSLEKNKFTFHWHVDKKGVLTSLEQAIRVRDDFRLSSVYTSKKDQTVIRGRDVDTGKIREKMPGLVLFHIQTNKGGLDYNY